jgi:quercetin dioxygenase-like cupin family protein
MIETEFRKKLQDEGFIEPHIYEAKPGPIAAMHCHDRSIMSLVLKGVFTMITEKGEKDYKAGDCCLNPAGTLHTEIFGADGATFLVGTKVPE